MMNDLINRQDAIEAMEQYLDKFDCIDVNFLDGLKTTKKILNDLPSVQPEVLACGNGELDAQPKQRWIPCSERLPEKGLRVLMQLDNIWQVVGWYDKEEADWYELTSEKPLDPNYRVLAWMPLPEPYTESEDKE